MEACRKHKNKNAKYNNTKRNLKKNRGSKKYLNEKQNYWKESMIPLIFTKK